MSYINNINFTNIGIYQQNSNGLSRTQKNTITEPSLFSGNSTNNINEQNQEIAEKISDESVRIASSYNIEPMKQKAERAENIINKTTVSPSLTSAGSKLYTTIMKLTDEFLELLGSVFDSCKNITDPKEVENKIKSIEIEISKKQQEISAYTQRIQMTATLCQKLENILSDPEKSELLKNIDFDKIASKLLEAPQINDTGIKGNSEEAGMLSTQNTEETSTNDDDNKLRNIISGIIEYAETGKKDKVPAEFINDNNTLEQNSSGGNQNTVTNPFSSGQANPFVQIQEKNPFLFKV